MTLPVLDLKPFPYTVYCCFSKEEWKANSHVLEGGIWDEGYYGQAVHYGGASCGTSIRCLTRVPRVLHRAHHWLGLPGMAITPATTTGVMKTKT